MHIECWTRNDSGMRDGQMVLIAPDIAVDARGMFIQAVARENNDKSYLRMRVDIDLYYFAPVNLMLVKSCSFAGSAIDGEGLQVSQMHKVPVEKVIAAFPPQLYAVDMENNLCIPLNDWEMLLNDVPLRKYRDDGPIENTLLWVARIYRVAQLLRKPPTKTVAERFGIPSRTASHWVKLMKERVWPNDAFSNFDLTKCKIDLRDDINDEKMSQKFQQIAAASVTCGHYKSLTHMID